jgi:transcriptional regulator with XRE-family HTH domain
MSDTFAERLKKIRKLQGINQIELAAFLSVAQNTVSNWEIGRAEPDMELTRKIAEYFNVTTDYLLGTSNIIEPTPSIDVQLACQINQLPSDSQEMLKKIIEQLPKKK